MSPPAPPVERDPSLARHVLATLAAVLAIDLFVVLVAGFLLGPWLAPLGRALADAADLGPVPPVLQWVAFVLPALAGFLRVQLRYTRERTLVAADARTVTPEERPALHARLGRLAQQADVRVPAVAVVDSEMPNCFTVGGARRATVVVSEGLLEALDGEELDAALAHELAHVKNRDAAVMTLASFLPALADGEFSLLGAFTPRGWSSRAAFLAVLGGFVGLYVVGTALAPGAPSMTPLDAGVLAALSLLFGGVALGVAAAPVVHLGGRLSRTREFAADRAGALTTGDPAALVSALRTLDEDTHHPPAEDARTRSRTVSGLCLLPYGFGEREGGSSPARARVRSHPTTAARIERLQALARSLEGT